MWSLAVECKQKRLLRGQNPPLKAFSGEDVLACLSLSCGLAHLPLLKHSPSAKCALAHILSTFSPFGGSKQDQVVIFIRSRQDWPAHLEQLVPSYDAPLYWQESAPKRAPSPQVSFMCIRQSTNNIACFMV